MRFFYYPNIKSDTIILPADESKHMARVLRLKLGEKVVFVDGKGGRYIAEISSNNPKKCEAIIIESQMDYQPLPYELHLGIAPTKNIDRFEWFLEKATEIGITSVTPLLCDNSERKVIKQERLDKIIVSAVKQSQKAYKPTLAPLTPFSQFIDLHTESQKYIAHCYQGEKQHFKNLIDPKMPITILIGPEGDFSLTELDLALKRNFIPCSLGESRLRAETAGVFAASIVNLFS